MGKARLLSLKMCLGFGELLTTLRSKVVQSGIMPNLRLHPYSNNAMG